MHEFSVWPLHGSVQLVQPRTSSRLPHAGSGRHAPVEGSIAKYVPPEHESAEQRAFKQTSELPQSFEVSHGLPEQPAAPSANETASETVTSRRFIVFLRGVGSARPLCSRYATAARAPTSRNYASGACARDLRLSEF